MENTPCPAELLSWVQPVQGKPPKNPENQFPAHQDTTDSIQFKKYINNNKERTTCFHVTSSDSLCAELSTGDSLKGPVLISGESNKVTFPATGNGHNNSTEQTYKPTLPSYRTR